MENPITLGIVEDQKLFLKGMKSLIEGWDEMELVFECPNGYSVISRLEETQKIPEIMLIDLTLPPDGAHEFNGWQVMEELRNHFPDMKHIILSAHHDPYTIAKLIEQGANGYLVKDSDPEEVRDAIQSVYEKGTYINMRTLDALKIKMDPKKKSLQPFESLSKREIEVLELICQQMTSEEIGEKLFISVKTVNGHRNNLLQKTGSKNVTGLVMYAIKHRIVEPV